MFGQIKVFKLIKRILRRFRQLTRLRLLLRWPVSSRQYLERYINTKKGDVITMVKFNFFYTVRVAMLYIFVKFVLVTYVTFAFRLFLNSSFNVFETWISLNIPSSFDVNWQPHSWRSLCIICFSESSDKDYSKYSYFKKVFNNSFEIIINCAL